jgi:hypothetical protein
MAAAKNRSSSADDHEIRYNLTKTMQRRLQNGGLSSKTCRPDRVGLFRCASEFVGSGRTRGLRQGSRLPPGAGERHCLGLIPDSPGSSRKGCSSAGCREVTEEMIGRFAVSANQGGCRSL